MGGDRVAPVPLGLIKILQSELRSQFQRCPDPLPQREAGARLIDGDDGKLTGLAGTARHQGVVARVTPLAPRHSLDDLLDEAKGPALVLVLDGITDPHNLGACLRVADAAGAHAVIVPKDRSAGLSPTVTKVASGATESVPFLAATNLARTLDAPRIERLGDC